MRFLRIETPLLALLVAFVPGAAPASAESNAALAKRMCRAMFDAGASSCRTDAKARTITAKVPVPANEIGRLCVLIRTKNQELDAHFAGPPWTLVLNADGLHSPKRCRLA